MSIKVQKGQVQYQGRDDFIVTYVVRDDGMQYYILNQNDGNKLANGNWIASTELVEAIDPMVKANKIGVIDENGNEVIPFVNRTIKPVNDDILLVEIATPISSSVVNANSLKSDPMSATKLVSTPAQIKDKLNVLMGSEGRYIFNDQFSEATICDINGNNLINNEYFSFIGVSGNKIYFSKNTVDSEITEYSILPLDVQEALPSAIDVNNVEVPMSSVEGALNNEGAPVTDSVVDNMPQDNDLGNEIVSNIAADSNDNVQPLTNSDADTNVYPEVQSIADSVDSNMNNNYIDVQSIATNDISQQINNAVQDVVSSQNVEIPSTTDINNVGMDLSINNEEVAEPVSDVSNVEVTADTNTDVVDTNINDADVSVNGADIDNNNNDNSSEIANNNAYSQDVALDIGYHDDNQEISNNEGEGLNEDNLSLNINDDTIDNEQVQEENSSENVMSNNIEIDNQDEYNIEFNRDEDIKDSNDLDIDFGDKGIEDSILDNMFNVSEDNKDNYIDEENNDFELGKEGSMNFGYESNNLYPDEKVEERGIMDDAARYLKALIKQNGQLKNEKNDIEKSFYSLKKTYSDKTAEYKHVVSELRNDVRSLNSNISRLENENTSLKSDVRGREKIVTKQRKIIEEQETEIKSLKKMLHGSRNLVGLFQDAKVLLDEDSSSIYDNDSESYYRRAS